MFEVKKLSRDVKIRFALSGRDLKAIEPLIKVENFRTAEIYSQFGGEDAEYSSRVWRQLIVDRLRFESEVGNALTNKQSGALRSARSRMERRLVRYLIEDYAALLGDVLAFREIEQNDVIKLFELDAEKKHKLISLHLASPSFLMKELDKVSEQTKSALRKILNSDQWDTLTMLMTESEMVG